MVNKAYVFQDCYAGVQIFVYHCNSLTLAKLKLSEVVVNSDNWIYLGQKIAQDA